MKIAITGNRNGIGESLSNIFKAHGHTVVGFNRSNGFDISIPVSRQTIVELSADADIFINNAYSIDHPFAQTEMLFDIWESWQGQKRTVVNITSSITERWQNTFRELRYRTAKQSIEDACEFLWNKEPWPHLMRVAPCKTSTPRTAGAPDTNMANPDEFAKLVYHALMQTNFRVQTLNLAVNPVE